MSDLNDHPSNGQKKITIKHDGPYGVHGKIPLVQKTQVVSEYGEPLTWKKDGEIDCAGEDYYLCRCGGSANKPFCDGTHRENDFDGTEVAKTDGPSDYQFDFRGTLLIVTKDPAICMSSGFCGMRNKEISQYVADSGDTEARSLAMAMVERCPSGALTYRIKKGDADIEPDLPVQVADTTEITSDGPISGPLWVTGCVEIERSDGQPFTERNRVTLCNCGLSRNKPLCDGTHRDVAQRLARAKRRQDKFS
jgi:CDGSH-type Zn-finger protein